MIQDIFPFKLQERLDRVEIVIYKIQSGEKRVNNPDKVMRLLQILAAKLHYKIDRLIEQQIEDDVSYNPKY